MNTITHLLHNPVALTAALIVVNALIDNMPAPDANSGKFYRFLYGTVHSIIGRIKSAKNGVTA